MNDQSYQNPQKQPRYAALLIDMQPGFLNEHNLDDQKMLFLAQRQILGFCVNENIPVGVLEYQGLTYPGFGQTVDCLREIVDRVPVHSLIQKDHDNGFESTPLDEQLHRWNATDLIVMGIYACCCVLDTCESARALGYSLHTARDCIADPISDASSYYWYEGCSTLYPTSSDLITAVKLSLQGRNLNLPLETVGDY